MGVQEERMSLGRYGEELAARYLESRGVEIRERNLHVANDEIDILAVWRNQLLVVEVKTRKGDRFGDGADAVTEAKVFRMRRAASRWLAAGDEKFDAVRFFVVEIDVVPTPQTLAVREVD